MVGNDVPQFLFHLNHQSEVLEFSVRRSNGTPFFFIARDTFVGRNTTAGGFFAQPWDGTTFRGGGSDPIVTFTAPDGDYTVTIKVVKALGDRSVPGDVETWVSPIFTIDRP